MKRIFFACMMMGLMCGCGSTRSSAGKSTPPKALSEINNVDNAFRMFMMDYTEEFDKASSVKTYKPSEQLCNHYSLNCEKNDCFVSGFLTVAENFDAEKAVKQGIVLNRMSDKVYTYQCALSNLDALLGLPNVKYIELAKKVNQRIY